MLSTQVLAVSLLWLIAVVNIANTEELKTRDETAEARLGVKTDFVRHVTEISDLLQMFTTLIKKADEEEGRELGLPEITTTVPMNLEHASLEELFDRFETAAQSFRTRFLKYLKTTETPYSSIAPTLSPMNELNEGEDLRKYAYENVAKVGSVPDAEVETEFSSSTVDPDVSDNNSSSEKSTLAFILSNEEVPGTKTDAEYSVTTEVPYASDSDLSSEASIAFILSNEEVPDSEMESEYSYSTVDPDSSDSDSSSDKSNLAFILSNVEDLSRETDESSTIAEKTSDENIILTLVQTAKENSESFIDETTSRSSIPFEISAEQIKTHISFDPEGNAALNVKPKLKPTREKSLNGAINLIFESTTENEDAEMEAKTLFSTIGYDSTLIPFTTTDDFSREFTLVPLSSTKDDDSGEETMEIRSTTEDDDSDEEITDIRSTTEDDDSDEETTDIRSTTEDDDFDEETTDIRSTTEDDDSDEETTEIHQTTEEDKRKTSSIEEITELIKILRKAAEYDAEESDTKSKFAKMSVDEELSDSASLIHDLRRSPLNTKQTSKVSDPSIEYLMPSISSGSGKKADEHASLKTSYLELSSGASDNLENVSDRIGMMHDQSVDSHLDDAIGVPGEDYPNYTNIPATSFTCEGKDTPGVYADLETRCQVFHGCWFYRMESYLCPVGSTFRQEILSCDYWFNSTCSLSSDYYDMNLLLRDYPEQDKYFEDSDIQPFNFAYVHSHPILKEMKFLPFMFKVINYPARRGEIESGREIDYNETVQIEFDQNSTLPTLEDLDQQETDADLVDSVEDRFRELLRSFVESEISKNAKHSDQDSSHHEMKLQERKYVYEKMSNSKLERSGTLLDAEFKGSVDADTTPPKSGENLGVLYKNTKSKTGKEQIAPAIVFKVLETAENVVNKGILPMTREMLVANYIRLYKMKNL